MEQIVIDEADLRLLDLLQTDASLSNQALAERAHLSPPTCLRRVKRLRRSGLIAREVALLDADRLAPLLGHGLTVLVEITLERQGAEALARTARPDHGVVLVPEGYHPVGAPHGYELYYLNVMAGPSRQWVFKNDPQHEWIIKK